MRTSDPVGYNTYPWVSTGTDCIRTTGVAVEVLGDDRPAVAEHGLPPGRGAERVQVNPFHGDQGMFGIALGHVWREVKGDLEVLPTAHIKGDLAVLPPRM
jgi:hypothetical protein